jgi:radical SAM protein with 4Fe4S-binding SPASM domain
LQNAADIAEKQGDKYTQCLALEKLSKVLGNSNPQKAVFAARKADRIYSSLPNATNINKVFSRLQVSVALLLADSLNLAEKECTEVIKLARLTEDSSCLSDAYQDMANILNGKKDYDASLWYSCQSYNLSEGKDNTKLLNLSWAYLDADSIDSCEKLVKRLRTDNFSELYTAYYIRHLAAIKKHDYSNAVSLADSAYHYIEEMYGNELNDKEKYYTSLVAVQYECLNNTEQGKFLIKSYKKLGVPTGTLLPPRYNYECIARLKNGYLIGPKGDLYKCWTDLGNLSMCLGYINDLDNISIDLLSEYMVGNDPFCDSECMKCVLFPICGGGCPHSRIMNQFHGAKNDNCCFAKENIEDFIETYYHLQQSINNF